MYIVIYIYIDRYTHIMIRNYGHNYKSVMHVCYTPRFAASHLGMFIRLDVAPSDINH